MEELRRVSSELARQWRHSNIRIPSQQELLRMLESKDHWEIQRRRKLRSAATQIDPRSVMAKIDATASVAMAQANKDKP
ncbi:hypothetical protein [Bradyrhizobium sp.]|uniref:hypothetical protein n=1 Tax=Bradyrhizobium sp. TaxID=376 RepID=UPI0026343CCB|nr:hypothetical protein [Bradyrhizobium sp.]